VYTCTRPCIRLCTQLSVCTECMRLCARYTVYGCVHVYGLCVGPCNGCAHGPYIWPCTPSCTRVYDHEAAVYGPCTRGHDRVHGCVHDTYTTVCKAQYTAVYMIVCTAVYTARTRPCTRSLARAWTRFVYTAVHTARIRPCTCWCTRAWIGVD